MTHSSRPRFDPAAEPGAYLDGLVRYARGRLSDGELHAWATQRLVLDIRLDHDAAEALVDESLEARGRPGRYFPASRHGTSLMRRSPSRGRLVV